MARSLIERGAALGHEMVALGRPELDLAGDQAAISAAALAVDADAIVSAAAYTAVDRAEEDHESAFAVNAAGPAAIAHAARRMGLPLVHLSTDYVFDGSKPSPYVETDEAGPTGVYGASKLAGERAVLEAHDNVTVLRTAWVYSPFGDNFVKTMLRLATDRPAVRVVADQYGNPTNALDIADGVLAVASNLIAGTRADQRGIFHMTGSGQASWAQFAEAIFTVSAARGGPSAEVQSIPTSLYPTAAVRPANSRLDCGKLAQFHGVRLPDWRLSLPPVVGRLLEELKA